MFNYQELCFHESRINQFKKNNDVITLILDEVDYGDKNAQVLIQCFNIKNIETDANVIEPNYIKDGDGEILTLNLQDHKVELIVQWHDHVLKSHDINFYHISCGEIKVSILNTT